MMVFARIALVLLVLGINAPAYASEGTLTVDLAEDSVDISTGFNGARLSLFGVKAQGDQVAVVIRGPKKDVVVRKKSKFLGTWMNRNSLKYEDIPQFYDFALSDAEKNILDEDARRENGIGFSALKFDPKKNKMKAAERKAFQSALLRNKQAEGLFPVAAKDIIFLSDTFFKTQFNVPANVPTGDYVIETFLIDDGAIVDTHQTNVKVAQVGFSAGVFKFAHHYSLLYAVLIVMIAVVAGWLSNAVRQNNK